jgi:mRNA interferase MazF
VRRGEIWTVAGGPDYAGKPRPVVVVQDDRFSDIDSVTICPFTTNATPAPLVRIVVAPSDANGLNAVSRLMADKLTTVSRAKLGRRIGRLDDATMLKFDRAMLVFLGMAG